MTIITLLVDSLKELSSFWIESSSPSVSRSAKSYTSTCCFAGGRQSERAVWAAALKSRDESDKTKLRHMMMNLIDPKIFHCLTH